MRARAGSLARAALFAGLWLATGCAAAGGEEPAPERSPELESLEMFVGRWESTSESVLADTGEVLHVTSSVDADWALGGEFIVSKARFLLEGGEGDSAWGRETRDIGVLTWDEEARVHRTWHFNDGGLYAEGTMQYEAETRTWRVSEESVDRRTGARARSVGTMRYFSEGERLIEWTSTPLSDQGGGFTSRGLSTRTKRRP